jgi:uncharacterized protein YjdB
MKFATTPLVLFLSLLCGLWAHAQSVTIHDGNYWTEEAGTPGYEAFANAVIAPAPGGNNGQGLADDRDPLIMFSVDESVPIGTVLVGLKRIGSAGYNLTLSFYEQDDITASAWTPGNLIYSETFAVPIYEGSSETGTLQLVLSGGVDLQPRSGTQGYALLLDVTSSSRAVMAGLGGLGDFTAMYYGRKDYSPAYKMEGSNRQQIGFVERVSVTGVSLDVETLELEPGETVTLTATVVPDNVTSDVVIWSSNDENYVQVDQSGKVTAINKGSATVTVTTADGGFTDSVVVTVTGEPVTGVSLSSERLSLEMGELGALLYAILQPVDAGNQIVSWSSEDPSVAEVSSTGLVTPVGEGSTTITVTTDEGGFTASVPVEVGSGWTEFSLHPNATIYYVSSSEGDDSNDGLTPETAFATINHGLTVIEGSDWLLMKRGDTFNEELSYWQNGASADYPTVFGAYGDLADPRPIIDPPGGYGMQLHGGSLGAPRQRPATIEHVAYVSLHFYNSRRDPNSPNFDLSSPSGYGVSMLRSGNDILFEDILSEWFGQWRIQADPKPLSNLTIRRSTIRNNYGGRAQGVYVNYLDGLTIEECVFDHNGWNEETNTLPTIFNHNLYLNSDGENYLVRRNLVARASSHGMQMRPGGIAEQNVFLNNSIAAFVSNYHITPEESIQILNDNVVLEGSVKPLYNEANPPGLVGTRSWGLLLNYSADMSYVDYGNPLEMRGNIVANGPAGSSQDYGIAAGLSEAPYQRADNITYNWGSDDDTIPAMPYPDPDRTSGSYNELLGGEATMEAFLQTAGEQRKGNWNPDYAWMGLWSYIREGFDQNTIHWRPVTGVELLGDSVLNFPVGRSIGIVAEVHPSIASQPRVFWESSDESVATVNERGLVSLVGAGTATITVMTMEGAFTDTVTVNAEVRARFEDQIGATPTSAGSMSYESSWLGYFWADESWGNWIYHVGLKWVNTSLVGDTSSFWLWNPTLNTWIYLNAGVYPWFWVSETNRTNAPLWVQRSANCWVYFYDPEGSEPAQLFYSPGGQWINYEQLRF